MMWVQEKQRCAKVWKAPPALSSSLLLWAAGRGIMKRRYHHFEQVFRQKLGQNLRQSSEAFSAFEAETCNCFRANSQYVEKLQWPWNSSSTLKRNSSSTNYFSNALPPPATEKVANEVNFQEFCLQISSAHLPLQSNFVFSLKFSFPLSDSSLLVWMWPTWSSDWWSDLSKLLWQGGKMARGESRFEI